MTHTTKHTPGPWEHKGHRVYRKDSYAVAWIEQQGPHSEWQANGKLIAAAPAMYEALQFVREFYQTHFDVMPIAFQTVDNICTTALSQAEGRQT